MVLGFLGNPAVTPQGFFKGILQPFSPLNRQGFMSLVVVPGAEPHDVFWGGWDLAKWARFDFLAVTIVDGCLIPGPHVLKLLLGEDFGGLFGSLPVEAAHQVLAVLPICQSAGALLLGFPMKRLLNGVPFVLQVDMGDAIGRVSRWSIPIHGDKQEWLPLGP